MKKLLSNKKAMLLVSVLMLLLFAGCQTNTDASGNILPERIIHLTTPWSAMFDESILSAILVYPLSQCINYIGKLTGSAVLGVVITTLLYNVLTLGMSIKSTVNTQKIQMMQPELNRIQAKYQGRDDDASRMQMAQEMQSLYNKHGINPMGSLLTPFLTMPIMIAMYYAAQRAEVVVDGTFFGVPLNTTPWAAVKSFSTQYPIVIMFVLMMVLQIVSIMLPQKLAEKKKKETKGYKAYADDAPKNNQANMMMYSMVILIGWLGIRWPSSMSLYWSVSSLAQILKTLYIQRRYIDNDEKVRG